MLSNPCSLFDHLALESGYLGFLAPDEVQFFGLDVLAKAENDNSHKRKARS